MPPENKEEEVVSVGVVFSENQVDSDQIEEVADHFQVSHPPEEVKETQEKPQFMSDKNSLFGKSLTLSSHLYSLFSRPGYEMPFDVISAGFAALVAGGGQSTSCFPPLIHFSSAGIMGYVKAGSVPSLAAGLLFGSVLGIGEYGEVTSKLVSTTLSLRCLSYFRKPEQLSLDSRLVCLRFSFDSLRFYALSGTSAVLGGLMGYRFINSGKFMPAGLITILSAGMVMRFGYRALTNWQNQKKA